MSTKLFIRLLQFYYEPNTYFRKKNILIKITVDQIFVHLQDCSEGEENILQKIEKFNSLADEINTQVNLIFFERNIKLETLFICKN